MKLKSRLLQIRLTESKNTKQLKICLGYIFYEFFKKKYKVEIFRDFGNSLVARAKMMKSTLFYLNSVCQTQ